jgi:tRNA G10  N-methylase Trm11
MVRLSRTGPRQVLLDPMCGAGTVLAERLSLDRQAPVLGGDIEAVAVRAAYGNLRHFGRPSLCRWDSRLLPLPDDSVERLACNPPFGKQLSPEEDLEEFYADLMFEWNRVLRRKGRAVLLVSDFEALARAAEGVGWERQQKLRVRILGQPAVLSVWQKA